MGTRSPAPAALTALSLSLLAALAAPACRRSSPSTGIVAEVTTDFQVPGELDEIDVSATGPDGAILYQQSFPLIASAGTRGYTLPLRVGFQPQGGATAPFRIEAAGLLGRNRVVSRGATLSFAQDRIVLVPLPLLAICRGVVCTGAAETCLEAGTCEPDGVDPSRLPDYRRGADAGMEPDAGDGGAQVSDAPRVDGSGAEARPPDAVDASDESPAADVAPDAPDAPDAPPLVTTLNDGLVGYWSFDQSGTVYPDNSINRNDTVPSPAPYWTADGAFGGALDLTATGNAVAIPASASVNSIRGAITVAAWVRPPPAGSVHTIVSRYLGGADWKLGFADNGALRMTLGTRVIQTAAIAGDGTQWIHVAGTYDGTTARLYVAGARILSTTVGAISLAGGGGDGGSAGGYEPVVGRSFVDITAEYIEDFNGAVDELTLYNRALTDVEAGALARGVFPARR